MRQKRHRERGSEWEGERHFGSPVNCRMPELIKVRMGVGANPGLIPITHMVVHNHPQLQFHRTWQPLLDSAGPIYTWYIDMPAGKIPIYIT